MNRRLYRIPAVMLLILFVSAILPMSAYASQGAVEAVLPVSVRVIGNAPVPAENYRFLLTPTDNAPMPQADRNFCETGCTGAGTVNFPAIIFHNAGVYHYSVSQIAGTHPQAHYDKTVYDVTVTVSNSPDYSSLSIATVISSNGKKLDTIGFVNTYDVSGGIVPPQLIQTGQLVWPIWVLTGAGTLLIAGSVRGRRKNKNE